jgi:hypothetical protein
MPRGGGMSIIGDFVFSEFDRYGHSGVDWLTGPSTSNLKDLIAIPHMAWRGEKTEGPILDAIRRNLPVTNLFYTKLAMD